MAARTAHIGVDAFQLELSSGVVIESGRFPLIGVMTTGAFGDFACICELVAVNLGVAFLAFHGSSLEVCLHKFHSHVGWPVAINTRDSTMCSL